MIEAMLFLAFDCVVVLAGGVLLAIVLRFGRAVLDAIPWSRAGLDVVGRSAPVIGVALVAVYGILAARWVLGDGDRQTQLAFGAVVILLAAASWPALRDAFAGVFLRAGRALAVGDRVRIGDVRGRVQRLGQRAAVIETIDGELAIVPYRVAASATIFREPGDEPRDGRTPFHVFRAPVPEDRSVPEVKRAVIEAAMLCHWSSTGRSPEIAACDDGHVEITVFPIDADHVADLERVVRRALTAPIARRPRSS
ncbi:MAG: mechanosensitive ion channel family protein [Deltaproteobacteria bacterium]|nr:mechanosensitive ion channel family protein [Kofleriaceae bacterium]